MTKISFIIPSFNEQDNILLLYNRILDVFKDTNFSIECIFIDDGSSDHTYSEVKKLTQLHHKKVSVIGIGFSRNFGKEAAMLAGFNKSSGDYTAVIDADMQQDPEYVLKMVSFLEKHYEYDVVACYQDERHESRILKICKSVFYSIADHISDIHFEKNASDFRTMRRSVVQALCGLPEYNRFSKGLFAWVGFNTYYMPYEVKERIHGSTSWSIKKLYRYALDGFIGFSSFPLRLSAICGAFIVLSSLVYLSVVLIQCVYGKSNAPEYVAIICLLLILNGVQMIFLGILGEYVSRMFLETKNRPIYIISRITEQEDLE